MATEDNSDSNTHVSRHLAASEVHALADRLFSRAVSVLSAISKEVRRDMVLASALLRRLANDNASGVDVDVWRELP